MEIEKNNNQNIINLNSRKELEIMQAMIEGEEKERTRLARDLHDGIGSRLGNWSIDPVYRYFCELFYRTRLRSNSPVTRQFEEKCEDLCFSRRFDLG